MTHREILNSKIDNTCILFVYIITTPAQLTTMLLDYVVAWVGCLSLYQHFITVSVFYTSLLSIFSGMTITSEKAICY